LIPGTKQSVASLLDITERKKTEEKLKDSEEKYRYLFDSAQVGLYWSRISDGNFLECNETFAKLFGYDTREEFLANYNAIEHYIDPNARSELIEEIRDNKEVRNYEIHVTRRDGTPIWLGLSTRIFEKEDRFEGAAIDITKRKQAERELQLERDNFLNILNSMVDGVYIVDKNFDIEYVNPILTKEFGQLKGKKCFKYFEDRNEPCLRCKNKEVFQGKTVRGEWFSFKNQKIYDVIDTPLKNPDGSISKLGIFRDISESKKAEQVLKESEEKYREAYNRAEFYKDLFAHDINNILQSILSGIQISQLIVDNPEKHDNLKINSEIIKEQVIRGAKLVSNVQKLSKLEEAGQNLEKIEVLNVLKNTISFVKKSYKDKNLATRVDSIGEKLFIIANSLLEDVFENLLINAIRHNKNSIIEITVRISRERKVGISYLKMEFLDNGFGVADSMKERIFQRGNSKEKGVYGMGLGLSLVRGIIESYNGKIWVEDRVKGDRSKGSNFVLLIPEVD
jgi:PAS domain S-box-containing protein